jgi:hypothetical protein
MKVFEFDEKGDKIIKRGAKKNYNFIRRLL